MTPHLIIRGFIIGLLISMPLGPISLMIIRRTANKNFKSGFFTALGAITCDTTYALLAGFSLSYIISFIRHYQMTIQVVGGIALLVLGVYIFQSNPFKKFKDNKKKEENHLQHFFTGWLVAVSNPGVMLGYIALFAGTGIVFKLDELGNMLFFIGGFTAGAFVWWIALTTTINAFRHQFNLSILYWFNKISGAAIILFVMASAIMILIKGSPEF